MRPSGSTPVASRITSPNPPMPNRPRWTKCQSLAKPSCAEYWHIGATTVRLRRVRLRRVTGENRLVMKHSWVEPGEADRTCTSSALSASADEEKVSGAFFPDAGQLHDGGHRLVHVLPADPLQRRVEGMTACKDVGAGQAHERQP